MTITVFAVSIPEALVGIALIYYSKSLSEKYNAWTTRLRSKSSHLKPPPSPQTAASNIRIMTILFRLIGAALIFAALTSIAFWAALTSLLR